MGSCELIWGIGVCVWMNDSGGNEFEGAILPLWKRAVTPLGADVLLLALAVSLAMDIWHLKVHCHGVLSVMCGVGSEIWWYPYPETGMTVVVFGAVLMLPIFWVLKRWGWPHWVAYGLALIGPPTAMFVGFPLN